MQQAAEAGREVYPIACVDLVARGLDLGRVVISTSFRTTPLGQVTHQSALGRWKEITYGSGIQGGSLDVVRTEIGIADPDGAILRKLETYDPRGSVARQWFGSPPVKVESDLEVTFTGILEDWERDGLVTVLIMKTDDSLLRKPIPGRAFSRTEWSSAVDSSIYETAQPLCMGVFDAFSVTGRGMVPCVNVRYDESLGYWWFHSAGHQQGITRVFVDGAVQDDAGWSVLRGVYGGGLATIISFAEGYQPDKDVTVSADSIGPDANGLYAGDPLEGPSEILRVVNEEYVLRDPPTGAWRGAHELFDATSWDAVASWLADRGYLCARRFGADQNPEAAIEAIQSYLDEHPWQRIQWTPEGKLSIFVIDPDDVEPSEDVLRIDLHHDGGRVDYRPGDRKEVYSHVRVRYLWSPAEGKFLGGLWAHDIAALPSRVEKEIQNSWAQGSFSGSPTVTT